MLASAALTFAQAGSELVASVIRALKEHPQPPRGRPAYTTGRTASQIAEMHGPDFVEVTGPQHVQTLITGRGPSQGNGSGGTGERLRDILAQWARDKGLTFDDPKMTFEQFGFLAARKMHREGSELYRLQQPSGLLDKVLTQQYLDTLLARVAAGEMVAITTALTHAIQGQ
jgi:hypothetical protein